MLSNNALSTNDDLLSKSMERLSSGLKINHAKDNPAGLAMGKRMNAQLRGLSVAAGNASDGVSVVETADGALAGVSDILSRMKELTVKAATGSVTDDDREIIQEEIQQLKEEITAISKQTQFNGKSLLNGEFERKGYTNEKALKVSYYSDEVQEKVYTINSLTVKTETDADGKSAGNKTVDMANGISLGSGFPSDVKISGVKDQIVTLRGGDGFEMKLDLTNADATTYTAVEVDVTGIGAMRLQIGANEGQILEADIPAVSLRNMGMESLDVSTQEKASKGISQVDGAVEFINHVRSKLGSYQNRLESTAGSLESYQESMTAAYSRLMDVDMAEEMTKYTTYQVLTQAGTSMVAQANESPSKVLQLLQ
jgi:flagellin